MIDIKILSLKSYVVSSEANDNINCVIFSSLILAIMRSILLILASYLISTIKGWIVLPFKDRFFRFFFIVHKIIGYKLTGLHT